MKKGFTLIELLAVIAILAIIMLIATPRIMDAIENSRIKALIQDEQMMIKATKTYFGNNVDLLPENVGDTVEVKLSELKTNEFISEIDDCNGYILVTKTEEGYSYNPELKCGDSKTIADSSGDGLIAYYTFDDFQEPTINNFPQNESLLSVDSTYADVEYNSFTNEWTLTKKTGAEYITFYFNNNFQQQTDTEYILSFDILTENNETLAYDANDYQIYLNGSVDNRIANNDTWRKSYSLSRYATGGKWSKITNHKTTKISGVDTFMTKYSYQDYELITVDSNHTAPCHDAVKVYNSNAIKVRNVQFEEKGYVTPYVDGTRIGIVKDYSLNDNNINLGLETTPTWMEENGNGYYEFDGASTYISTPSTPADFTNLNQLTVSAWVQSGTIEEMDCIFYLNALRTYIQDDGIIEVIFTSKAGEQVVKYSSNKVNTGYNGWDKVTFTYDGTNFISYINGKKEEALSFELIGEIANGINFQIGKYPSDTYPHWYNGYIDDVKIYNRALSAEEIKYQYDTKKEIYN